MVSVIFILDFQLFWFRLTDKIDVEYNKIIKLM